MVSSVLSGAAESVNGQQLHRKLLTDSISISIVCLNSQYVAHKCVHSKLVVHYLFILQCNIIEDKVTPYCDLRSTFLYLSSAGLCFGS